MLKKEKLLYKHAKNYALWVERETLFEMTIEATGSSHLRAIVIKTTWRLTEAAARNFREHVTRFHEAFCSSLTRPALSSWSLINEMSISESLYSMHGANVATIISRCLVHFRTR